MKNCQLQYTDPLNERRAASCDDDNDGFVVDTTHTHALSVQ